MTAAATTGPASGPRPASSQPATGQMPFASARRSRRNVGRTSSSRSGRRSAFFAVLAAAVRLMSAILRAGALKSNGTQFRLRMAGKTLANPAGPGAPRRSTRSPAPAQPPRHDHPDRQSILDSRRIRSSPAVAAGRRQPRSRLAHPLRPRDRPAAPTAIALAKTASTSAGVAQFQASVTPRKVCGLGFDEITVSSASLSQSHSAKTTPPASKNTISSPVARTFRLKPKAS